MSLLLKVCVHLFSIPMELFFFSKKKACILLLQSSGFTAALREALHCDIEFPF